MTTCTSPTSVPAISHDLGSRPARVVRRAVRFLEAAFQVSAERRRLSTLDDRMLKDIGMSRSIADREASREFFDVPEHRIRLR